MLVLRGHPNIIRFFGFFADDSYMYIVMVSPPFFFMYGNIFMHGSIAARYFRNHDKSTLRSACHAWQACMQRNRRFRHAHVRAFPDFCVGS